MPEHGSVRVSHNNSHARFARVLIATSLPQFNEPLTYEIPLRLQESIVVGCRVKVPLRKREVSGFVLELSTESNFHGEHQEISEVISSVPVMSSEVIAVATTLSERFVSNVYDVLRLIIPTRQVRVEKKWWNEFSELFHDQHSRAVAADPISLPDVVNITTSPIPSLSDEDYRTLFEPNVRLHWNVTPGTDGGPMWAKEIIQYASSLVLSGQSVIIVVPDFRDIEQIQDAFNILDLDNVPFLRLDSNQSNQEKYRHFLETLKPTPSIIVGNRSAVLSPAYSLGAIIVWEESDPSHEEPLSPYHRTYDAALLRATQTPCRLIFAGHSTSYSVERLIGIGWLDRIRSRSTKPSIRVPASEEAQRGFRIPTEIVQAMQKALPHSSCLIQVAKPSRAKELFPEDQLATVSETAKQFGMSFPQSKIVIAEADHIVQYITEPNTIVVATRGTEPVYPPGYHVVALLDAGRMIENEEFSIIEDLFRSWYAAASQANPNGHVFIHGLAPNLERAFVLWQPERYIRDDLQFRKQLQLPPYVRLLSIRGSRQAVHQTAARVRKTLAQFSATSDEQISNLEELTIEPKMAEDESEIILKLDFLDAPKILDTLREQIIYYSTGPIKQRKRLRIRFYDSGRGVFS